LEAEVGAHPELYGRSKHHPLVLGYTEQVAELKTALTTVKAAYDKAIERYHPYRDDPSPMATDKNLRRVAGFSGEEKDVAVLIDASYKAMENNFTPRTIHTVVRFITQAAAVASSEESVLQLKDLALDITGGMFEWLRKHAARSEETARPQFSRDDYQKVKATLDDLRLGAQPPLRSFSVAEVARSNHD
jgi:hypothetical protein